MPTALHLQEDLRRVREERTVSTRDLQLDASSAKAEAARLAQELHEAESAAEGLRRAAEEAQRAAQQVGGGPGVQHSGE
jgi:hypothetical protein